MKYDIVYFGHDSLRKEAEKIIEFDESLKDLSKDMFRLMQEYNGIGLAGPQIDYNYKIVAIDLTCYERDEKLVLLNPEVVWTSKKTGPFQEGCLSVPGIFEDVIRPLEVVVKAQDLNGKELEIKGDDILARVLQHEVDHLNGILFVDHLEEYVRKEYTRELKKIKKLNRAS